MKFNITFSLVSHNYTMTYRPEAEASLKAWIEANASEIVSFEVESLHNDSDIITDAHILSADIEIMIEDQSNATAFNWDA